MSTKPFDFDAFINGTKQTTKTFHLYGVDNRGEMDDLRARLESGDLGDDDRLGVPSEAAQIAEEIERLAAEMDDSKVAFKLRSLTSADIDAIGDDESDCAQLAAQSVDPVLDKDQWQQIKAHVNVMAWRMFMAEVNELVASEVVTPDFSRVTSPILRPEVS